MSYSVKLRSVLTAGLLSVSCIAMAQAAGVDDLGKSLTPVGAERAGNADGTIPEWAGGITAPPAGWTVGQPRVNPYAGDAKLFSIDGGNIDQYKDKLSEGQIALIKRYPGYRMDVYPTRRSCAYPERVYERTRANIAETKMDESGHITAGYGGFPFPIPTTGWEVIQNHRSAYRGYGVISTPAMAVMQGGDRYILNVGDQVSYTPQYDPKTKSFADTKGFRGKFIYTQTQPAASVGGVLLVHEYYNGRKESWGYIPGLRRVKQAPNAAYDNPVPGQDGLRTFDQTFMFNGDGDRYDWKLVGKKELYVPYNAWALKDQKLTIKDIVGPDYPNRDLIRYELHRVWVVEATVKPGIRNILPRRTFYVDEDSWTIVLADLYDTKGNLWRTQENSLYVASELPACVTAADFYFDLSAGRYIADNMILGNATENYLAGASVDGERFTPSSLRQTGMR